MTFGDDVMIGPNCCFSTAGPPLDAETRDQGLEYAYPITVGSHMSGFGANVTVLPGVTIGDNSVIGAGRCGDPRYSRRSGGGGPPAGCCGKSPRKIKWFLKGSKAKKKPGRAVWQRGPWFFYIVVTVT